MVLVDKRKEYARYAQHCLKMVDAASGDWTTWCGSPCDPKDL
jgi:hypothetical protein